MDAELAREMQRHFGYIFACSTCEIGQANLNKDAGLIEPMCSRTCGHKSKFADRAGPDLSGVCYRCGRRVDLVWTESGLRQCRVEHLQNEQYRDCLGRY